MRSTHQSWGFLFLGGGGIFGAKPEWWVARMGEGNGGAVKGLPDVSVSDGIQFQLTPASLNRWTSPERWPPLSSSRSSVSSSLCSKKKKQRQISNISLKSLHMQPMAFSCAWEWSMPLGQRLTLTHMIFGWLGSAFSLEVASAGWAPEWLT